MLRFLISSLALFSLCSLPAQDLHVYYDAFSDSVYYLQNGKPVRRPAVRQGANVVLHVNNYNNYLYNIQLQTSESKSTIATGSLVDVQGLIGGAGNPEPLKLLFGAGSSIGGLFQLTGLGKTSGAGATAAEQARQALTEEASKQVAAFNAAQERMQILAEEMATTQEEIRTVLEAQQVQAFVAGELDRLRYNPQLEPRQIRQLSQEYMARIFGVADPRLLDLTQVLEKTNQAGNFSALKEKYTQQIQAYSRNLGVLRATSGVLGEPRFDFPESNLGRFRSEAVQVIGRAEGNLTLFEANLNRAAEKGNDLKSLDAETLTGLRTSYLVLMENSFAKTYRQPATGESLRLELSLQPNVADSAAIGVRTQHLAPIEVNVYGGLQINASLGVGFGSFFKRPESFCVRDSVILSSEKDAFSPYLSSFVHFYAQGRGGVSVGGSFGLGIPLGGAAGSLESITFFFGPSLVLGRGQRVVLSAGLMGGKVEQLSNGYAVGDRFELNDASLLSTESAYRLGGFIGISFNLLGGSR